MTQTTMICSKLNRSWRRRLTLLGLGFTVALPISTVVAESPSLRHTTTVLAIQRAEPAVVNIEGNKPATNSSGARAGGRNAARSEDRRGTQAGGSRARTRNGRTVPQASRRQGAGIGIERQADSAGNAGRSAWGQGRRS